MYVPPELPEGVAEEDHEAVHAMIAEHQKDVGCTCRPTVRVLGLAMVLTPEGPMVGATLFVDHTGLCYSSGRNN